MPDFAVAVPRPPVRGLWGFFDRVRRSILRVGPSIPATNRTSRSTPIAPRDIETDSDVIEPSTSRERTPTPPPIPNASLLLTMQRGLSEVPPLPLVVRELLAELSDPDSTARSVARIASSDQVLAASLIRTVNSAAFGLRRKVTSVAEAISFLGYGTMRSLVVKMRLERVLPRPAGQRGYDVEDLWVHSMAVAHAAEALAEKSTLADKGYVSTLGLLHDIGKLAINCHFPDSAQALVDRSKQHPEESFLDRERRVLGADHAEIGAMLATHWKLPTDLVEAIRWHHAPQLAPPSLSPTVRKAAMLVHLANQLAKFCYVFSEDMEIDIVPDEVFEEVGLAGPMSRLLSSRTRASISRAIFFAGDMSAEPVPAVRRFVKFCSKEEADRAMRKRRSRSPNEPRVRIIETGEETLFPPHIPSIEATHVPARAGSARWSGKPTARFAGPASGNAAKSLVAFAEAHLDSLKIDEQTKLPARFLIRRLIPNLVAFAEGERIEICQNLVGKTLRVAIRCEAMRFDRRFDPGINPRVARRVLEQDFANVLNLRWFAGVYTSKDGTTLCFDSYPMR